MFPTLLLGWTPGVVRATKLLPGVPAPEARGALLEGSVVQWLHAYRQIARLELDARGVAVDDPRRRPTGCRCRVWLASEQGEGP